MNPLVRNVLVVISGIILGSVVNMALIYLGPLIIPPPEGVDMTTPEGLKAAMPLMTFKHFIFPFLAHAAGTFAGAFLVAKLAASNHKMLTMVIAVFFLLGGLYMVMEFSGPGWFNAADLLLAYIPAGWLGWKLGRGY